MTETNVTPEAIHADIEKFTTRREDGKFPRVAGVNGTTFDPPMSIEAVTPLDQMGVSISRANIKWGAEVFGIEITAWPTNGWMVGLALTFGMGNTVKIEWTD